MSCFSRTVAAIPILVGTSRTIRLTLTDRDTSERINLGGSTIVYFMLGESVGEDQALVEKDSGGAEVTILDQTIGADTEGQVEIELVPDDTLGLPHVNHEYVWNVLGVLDSGKRVGMVSPRGLQVCDTVGRLPIP
jgi:hypothetical protein